MVLNYIIDYLIFLREAWNQRKNLSRKSAKEMYNKFLEDFMPNLKKNEENNFDFDEDREDYCEENVSSV